MGRRDKRIVSVLDHARRERHREFLGFYVEKSQHHVDAPPAHKVYCVRFDAHHDESHSAAGSHQARADVVQYEAQLGSNDIGSVAEF